MTRNFKHLVLLFIITMLTPGISHAQQSIDNLIKKLEKDPRCETTFYNESREVTTHTLVKLEMKMDIKDKAIAQRIIDAFKKERDNSSSCGMSTGEKSKTTTYHIRFMDPDGYTMTYFLTSFPIKSKYSNNTWKLIVKKSVEPDNIKNVVNRSKKNSKKHSAGKSKDGAYTLPGVIETDLDYIVTAI